MNTFFSLLFSHIDIIRFTKIWLFRFLRLTSTRVKFFSLLSKMVKQRSNLKIYIVKIFLSAPRSPLSEKSSVTLSVEGQVIFSAVTHVEVLKYDKMLDSRIFFIPSSFEDFKTIKFCKFAPSLRDFKIRFFFNYCSTIIRSENMRQICFGVWDRSKTPLYKLSKSNYLFVLRYFGLRKVSSECMCGINST